MDQEDQEIHKDDLIMTKEGLYLEVEEEEYKELQVPHDNILSQQEEVDQDLVLWEREVDLLEAEQELLWQDLKREGTNNKEQSDLLIKNLLSEPNHSKHQRGDWRSEISMTNRLPMMILR